MYCSWVGWANASTCGFKIDRPKMTEAEILRIHLFDLLFPFFNHHCRVHIHSSSSHHHHHHQHHRIQARVYEGPIALVGQGLLKWSSVWRGFLMLPIFASYNLDNCQAILPLDNIDNHQAIWWPYICFDSPVALVTVLCQSVITPLRYNRNSHISF